MPLFARLLKESYEARGHEVTVWVPKPIVHRFVAGTSLAKWAGYFDQYLLFPQWVRRALKTTSADTLFVFCDQALGPWVPLVKDRPHVVHVHDLLALRSALGDVTENPTALTGRIYQRYIRRGFQRARHFISVSNKSRHDLHRFGGVSPQISEVVLNGLNYPFAPIAAAEARGILLAAGLPAADQGMVLHVGGGAWYKNLVGVLLAYANYAARNSDAIPLWCVTHEPNAAAKAALESVPPNGRVVFLRNLDSRTLQAAYSHARVMLFPSLEEGFGWPLIEAQACGCPVITTDEPPMNEVGGPAARYLPRLRAGCDAGVWAAQGGALLTEIVAQSAEERAALSRRACEWAQHFDAANAIDQYLTIYRRVLDEAL